MALCRGSSCSRFSSQFGHYETRRTCLVILKVKPALWTFIDREGVEPTNNAAERALRRGDLWRKRSFGTQRKAGSVFVERILTAAMTLRQQKHNVLDYLAAASKATIRGCSCSFVVARWFVRFLAAFLLGHLNAYLYREQAHRHFLNGGGLAHILRSLP